MDPDFYCILVYIRHSPIFIVIPTERCTVRASVKMKSNRNMYVKVEIVQKFMPGYILLTQLVVTEQKLLLIFGVQTQLCKKTDGNIIKTI